MLSASRHAVREQFAAVTTIRDDAHLKELLAGVDEAVDMLKHQIVQGVRTGEGSYTLQTEPRHATNTGSIPGNLSSS